MYLAYLLTLYQILQIGTLQDINLSRSKLFKHFIGQFLMR